MENICNSEMEQVEVRKVGDLVGKGMFALKDFNEGEIIFQEEPLVSCQFLWNAAYGYLACDHCMRPLETAEENARRLSQNAELMLPQVQNNAEPNYPPSRCHQCNVSYCSDICQEKAWHQYHRTLCLNSLTKDPNHPLVILQEAWKTIHYPPESTSIMLLARIFATVKQAGDKNAATSAFMSFCHRTTNEEEEIAHKLLGEEFRNQLDSLRMFMERALGGSDVQQWLTPEGFRSLVALIGTNGQGIGSSPLSVWVKACDAQTVPDDERAAIDAFIDDLYENLNETVGSFLNSEGSGLYSLQSSCNHSCEPNAIPTFPNNNFRLVMTALKPIKSGDEICISYLDECNLNRSRHSRIKHLRENYLFSCECCKCEAQRDELDLTSEEEMDDQD